MMRLFVIPRIIHLGGSGHVKWYKKVQWICFYWGSSIRLCSSFGCNSDDHLDL